MIRGRSARDKTLKERKLDRNSSEKYSWEISLSGSLSFFIPELIPINRYCITLHNAQMDLVSSIPCLA